MVMNMMMMTTTMMVMMVMMMMTTTKRKNVVPRKVEFFVHALELLRSSAWHATLEDILQCSKWRSCHV